ncbi:hypothetical protein [Robbsia sp. KACC 23696]|uniref:hypothetical protein n=1 Tax=Robbsia sp. KACC 23696 TaxID=3149231 RepID=UPI00325BE379
MPIDSSHPTRAARDTLQARYAGLSPRQARAVQKELLIARAALERLSIAEASADLRSHFTGLGALGLIGRLFGRSRAAAGGQPGLTALLGVLPDFLQPFARAVLPLLARYPLFSGLISLILGGRSSGALQRAGKAGKWAGLAVVGLKTLGIARRLRSWRSSRQQRKAARRGAV